MDDVITSDLFHSNFAKKTDELESSQRESDDIELEELPGVEDIPLYHVGRGLWGDIRYEDFLGLGLTRMSEVVGYGGLLICFQGVEFQSMVRILLMDSII